MGQRLGDRGVGAQHDGLRRHEAARGVRGVAQQPPHRRGLVGLHQGEQPVGVGGGQLFQQVGGVIGGHRLQHVRGAVGADVRHQRALVGLGHLLEDVGEPLVVERVDHLVPPLFRQLGQRRGDVGGPHRLQHGEQPRRALPVGEREPGDRPPRHDLRLPAPSQPAPPLPHREPAHHPVAGPGVLHRGVDDDGVLAVVAAGVGQPHRSVDQLADDERLVGTLHEPAQADQARGEGDGAGVDRRDPQHRHEDPPPRHHLDDHAEHARRVRVDPKARDQVAHPPDPLAVWPVDRKADQPRDEDALRSHVKSLVRGPRTPPGDRVPGGGRRCGPKLTGALREGENAATRLRARRRTVVATLVPVHG